MISDCNPLPGCDVLYVVSRYHYTSQRSGCGCGRKEQSATHCHRHPWFMRADPSCRPVYEAGKRCTGWEEREMVWGMVHCPTSGGSFLRYRRDPSNDASWRRMKQLIGRDRESEQWISERGVSDTKREMNFPLLSRDYFFLNEINKWNQLFVWVWFDIELKNNLIASSLEIKLNFYCVEKMLIKL